MKLKIPSWAIIAVLSVLVLTVGISTFLGNLQELRNEVENTFKNRVELIQKFMNQQSDRVYMMTSLMVKNYAVQHSDNDVAFEFHLYPEFKSWELTTRQFSTSGSVVGNAPLPISDAVRREIRAALSLDIQINLSLKLDPDIVWMYYQSAKNFVYLAPLDASQRFKFNPDIYKHRYWLTALPDVNPEKRLILAGPYMDEAGKGWIITLANPVYYKDTFLGITALDLKVVTLNKLVGLGNATGESMLISENGRLMASEHEFDTEQIIHTPVNNKSMTWYNDKNRNLWLSSSIIKDEMQLVHRVTLTELYKAAAQKSMTIWLMLLTLAIVSYLLWRLKVALREVTRITYTDPLTQALNRRGLYVKLETLLAFAKRNNLPIAVLMLDIDFFKKINDNYSHAVGDSVLAQLGAYLLGARRPYDLVCRWGGEEFVVAILLDSENEAMHAAERLRQEAQRTKIDGTGESIHLSGGLVIKQENEDIESAIKRADTLLYQAKENGRNRIMTDVD